MFCHKCGAKAEDDEEFCTECGARLNKKKNHKEHSKHNFKTDESEQQSSEESLKINGTLILIIILGIVFVAAIMIFAIPFPYTTTETYSEQVPYNDIEYYTEDIPITVEECKTDISLNPADYFERGINALLTGEIEQLIKACKDVMGYRTVNKTREVTKWLTVQKQRTVTRYATLFSQWTNKPYLYNKI